MNRCTECGRDRARSIGTHMQIMSSLKKVIAVLLIIPLNALTLPAQQKFEAIPKDLVSKYKFDLTRYFFADPTAEQASRKELFETLEKLEKLKGRVRDTAD